jgi:hypothetical protein
MKCNSAGVKMRRVSFLKKFQALLRRGEDVYDFIL